MTRVLIRAALVAAAATLLAGCGDAAVSPGGPHPAGSTSNAAQSAGDQGKSLDNFDPCSVVSDSDYVAAITAEGSDPSALGKITATHAPLEAGVVGLPGSKSCKLSYTTTDADGRVSLGGDPVIVTFEKYSNLHDYQGNNPKTVNDYQSAGASAFEGPGSSAADPYITKNGYLFRLSGNSDTAFLKKIALGIAGRL